MKNKLSTFYASVLLFFLCPLVLSLSLLSGCTQQAMTKEFGGTTTLELEPGYKLIEITWKDDNLWYLVRPLEEGEEPTTYIFQEKSSFGLIEGTVKIIESKKD